MSRVHFMDQLLRDFKDVTQDESFLKEESTAILTNNKNRLKLKEFTKKLSHYKQELVNQINTIDLEYARFKEAKISMATVITREINKLQKQDEDQIKEQLGALKKLVDFNQRMTIEIENVFENQQTVTKNEVEAASQAFQEIEQQVLAAKMKKLDLGSMDFKLLSMNEYNNMIVQIQEQKLSEQPDKLFKNEQKINLMLSQQLEEKNQIIHQLQNSNNETSLLREYEKYIEQQFERFQIPFPKSNSNILKYAFDSLDQVLYKQEQEIKLLQSSLLKYQQENDEIKQINEEVIKENKTIQNQIKSKIDQKEVEKIKLQDELTNILNNSIEVEKENQVFNNQLQLYTHQIKQLQKSNTNLYKDLSRYKEEVEELNDVRLKLEEECEKHLSIIDKLNQQNNELETLLYKSSENNECQEIEKFKQLQRQNLAQIKEFQEELENKQTQIQKQQQTQKQQEEQLIELRKEVQELETHINQLESDLKKAKKLNDKLQQQIKESFDHKSEEGLEESYQIKYNELQKEFKEYKASADSRIKRAVNQSQELQVKLQQQEQDNLLESHKMIEKESALKNENMLLQQKANILQEQVKQLELTYLNEIKLTKASLESQQSQYTQQSQLFDKLKQQASQLEQAVLEKEQLIQELQQELDSNSAQYEQQANEIQLEYNQIIDEKQEQIQKQEITISNQKHQIMLLQRQVDQLEFQKQQDLLQYKIENDKKSLQFSKELEQVKDVLNSSVSFQQAKETEKGFQKKLQQIQDSQNKTIIQTQQKYEQIIQDLVLQYDKQIGHLQEQLSFTRGDTLQNNRLSQKPPRAAQKSPNCYTNSPASSIQQSFYREVARFSKDLDESHEEKQPIRRPTGIMKQNKHIFIEDDNISQEQVSSVQNYSNSCRNQYIDHAIQTEQQNEDIFPPFDHRICLRCKKNDMIAPNFCKFKEVNQFTDLSATQGSASRLKSSRVLKEHIYGSNLSWRQRETNSVTKSNYFSIGEKITQGVNTILSLINIENTQNKRSSSQKRNKRNSESLSISFSSKIDTNRSNQ